MSATYGTIEVVRGRLSEERADQLVTFWTREGVLSESAARARLGEVVCVLIDPDGEIAGVNSVYPAALELVAGRQFWVYRSYLSSSAEAPRRAMAQRAFAVLHAEFDPAVEGPLGICFLLGRAEIESNPAADWIHPVCRYAGYLNDGRQVRIRYFEGARVGPAREMIDIPLTADHRYRVAPFARQDAVDADAIAEFWVREGAMPEDEARRRVDEVLTIATTADGELAGVATAYLGHHPQLRMDVWYFRAFVAAEHRATRAGWSLAVTSRDYLRERFVAGQETRGSALVYEVENEGLKQHLDFGYWPTMEFLFIGENERGDHVRVHYMPGAVAPGPPE